MELDVVAQNLLCGKSGTERCGETHVCVRAPTYTVQSFLSKAVLVLVSVCNKKKVLWDGLAASRLFCPKYSLPHLIKAEQDLYRCFLGPYLCCCNGWFICSPVCLRGFFPF